MKILFLISRFLDGGIDTVLVEYLNSIVSLTDHEVELSISLRMNEAEVFLPRLSEKVKVHYLVDQDWMTAYKRSKHHHRRRPLLGMLDELLVNPLRRLQMHRRLCRLSKGKDVVVDFDSCHASFMSAIPHGTKKLAWFHFSFNQEMRRDPRRINRLKRRCQKYDRMVMISDDMQREFMALCPEYASRVVRIYNSVNLETMQMKSSQALPSEWEQNPFILAIERLEESQKDLTTLIRAYSLLDMADKPHLCIIGEGASRQQLEALIRELKVDDCVYLLGFQSNPYPWIRKAEMVVHSSKFEGLPTVLIESLLMGKVIVCSDCPTGPREILNDGKAGILVPMGDAQAMADAIKRALTDSDLRSSLLINAREHCKLFTSEQCVHDFNRLINS